ncbi:hypothetical protein FBQ97_19235, partial [Acidobacteria bacterium ACD]|nr:hypothetical protein [Acidobacteria bacterium ACD]
MPPSVTVPEGATTATFPVTAGSVSTDTGVTLTATLAAVSRTATLTVLAPPPTLSGVSVTPAVVFGGSPADGTLTLTGNAPAGGVTVSLVSSQPSVASVPASVVVPQGAASAGFAVSTSPVASDTVATVTATAGGTSRQATLSVRRATAAPLDVDLAEGNATSWTGFAGDGATTSVSDDLSLVASGASSLRFVTQSGLDTGVRYAFPGGAHWDLAAADFLSFQAFPVNPNPPGFQDAQPVVVLVGPSGSLRFTPSTVRSVTGAWRRHRVPLSADSEWTRTVDGTFSLADVVAIEIHQDTWDARFTVNYDDVRFASALPGDLTEGNALRWEPYAEDGAAVSVADEAARVKVGSRALLFTTGSGFSTGVRYPLGGEPHWDLSGVESLSFWTWATNSNTFQGPQPVVYLHSPDGSYRYEPTDTLMTVDGWRYHEVPLAGDEVWARTQGDEPSLSDVIAVEILHDTWDYGFTVVYDGVSFGRPLPELVLDAPSAEGGSPVTGTVRLGTPAPAGGRVVSLSSSDPTVASVPSTVTVPEGALSAPFTVTTAPVSYDRYVWVSFDDAGVSRASSLQVTPPLGVSALSLSPSTVVPGGSATGTVTLTRAAPAGGLTVALSATPAGAVTLLPSVAVPAGETWATFQVQVDAAAATSPVTITASYGTTTRTASLGLYQVSVLTVTPS